MQHRFAAVEIFFDSMAVKVVERHEKMPIQELISNAGGLIGLCPIGVVLKD